MSFYPNECYVCKTTAGSLKRCSRCNMVSYCGEAHQKQDWKYHKGICKVIFEIISEWGVSHVLEGLRNADRKTWKSAREDRRNVIEGRLPRDFNAEEVQMFRFPRACFVCHDVNQKLLKNCPGCPLASFCKDHPSSPLHDRDCSNIKQVYEWERGMDPRLAIQTPQTIPIIIKNISSSVVPTSIQEFIANGLGNHSSPECVRFSLGEQFSPPLTIYNALQKLKASNKTQKSVSNMVIHVRGISTAYMEAQSNAWESLFHLIPEWTNLTIIVFGHYKIFKREVTGLCNECNSKKKKLSIETFRTRYSEYFGGLNYKKPNIIAAFNIAPPEYNDFHKNAPWKVELEFWNKSNCPLVLTMITEKKANLTSKMLRSSYWDNRICYKGINHFSGMYLIREWEGCGVCKSSEYTVVVKGVEKNIADLEREEREETKLLYKTIKEFQEPIKKPLNVVFSPSLCHVCQVNNTSVSCKRCKMIFYCGENHMKVDAPHHKEICKVILGMLIETGSTTIYDNLKTSDSELWLMAKFGLMKRVKTKIERELKEFEKEMILFPRTCFICHESDLSVLKNCGCGIVLCKIHKEHSKHKEICSDYFIAMKLKMNKYLPTVIAYVSPDLFDNINDIIPPSIESFMYSYLESIKPICAKTGFAEMQNVVVADALSMGFSLFFAILKLNLFSKKKLKIHILGKFHSDVEEKGFWLMLNCLKNLETLECIFFNPVLKAKQLVDYKLDLVFANLSLFSKKNLEGSICQISYDQYCKLKPFEKPHIIIGYNLNIHEVDYGISKFNWKDIILLLKRMNAPFVLTSESEERAKKDHCKMCSFLGNEVEFLSSQENPYASSFPERDFQSEGLRYSNKWMTVYTDFNKKVTSEPIVQKN